METFSYGADVGSGLELETRVKEAKFGNGYAQTVGDGLNPISEKWSYSFFGDISVVKPAYDFLKRHGGTKSFRWLTPLGHTIQVKATDIKLPSNGASTYTLSATFTQSFTPD